MKMHRVFSVTALASLVLSAGPLFSPPLRAADGDLDPAFGAGGRVLTGFPAFATPVDPNGPFSAYGVARAVAVQPDGKIVVAGTATPPGRARGGSRCGADTSQA